MKKYFLLLASAALLLAGCVKEQSGPGAVNDGDMVDVAITAGTAEMTKALIDSDGAAANVTRWIMEVRDVSGDVYAYKVGTEEAGTLQHTFNIKLFKNQKYTFAFWADNGDEYYDASDLSAVKYADGKAVVASVDAKDAFSGAETLTFTESITRSITLHRPFAQLNVITKDLADLKSDIASTEVYNAFKPKNFKTTIKVPTQFNVLTGAASQETELILSADEFYGKSPLSYEDAPELATMFMAYIFATKDEKDIRNVNFKFDVDSQTGNNAFVINDVPFQRNYRTNILGNFLSGDAEWTVVIDKEWNGEYDYPPFEAGSIEAANASLAAGETNISITNPSDFATVNLTIPKASNGKDLIIEVADKADMDLKVDASASTPKSISLSAGTAKSLVVNAPATHVELTAGNYTGTVEATTSATTLVVGKAVTIKTLTIKGGNAVIDGSVEGFINQTGGALVWNVANTAELANAVRFAGAGDEIKVAAGNYTMPAKVETSGLKISGVGGAVIDCPATCTISADDVVFKDLTINYNSSITGNYGALYATSDAQLVNCTFTGGVDASSNIVVVGGTGTVKFTDCRFENKGKGRGIKVWGGSPEIIVDGCYFDNTYPFNVDGGNPTFNFTNSTLNGWCSWGKGTVSIEGCDFGKSTNGYAYCRPYQNTVFNKCNFCEGYHIDFGAEGIEIDLNNCKLGGQPMTAAILEPELQATENCILRIDGVEVYPFTSWEVSTVEDFKKAVEEANKGKRAVEYTIIVNDGTYEVSDMAIAENVNNKTLVIKAANEGQVTLKMNADTKSKQIFLVDGYSGNHSSYRLVIDGFKFDLTAVTNGDAAPVYAFQAGDSKAATIGYTTAGPNLRYAHNITIQNCELKGAAENAMMFYSQSNTSPNNIVVKDCSIANVGYLFSGYCDTFTATGVTATNVKHFINNQGEGITMDDCTVDCYTDYAVRANAGPVSITGSTFVMTYAGTEKGGVYVDRGANTQLTMTGNTYPASYAGANMHDVYNEGGGVCTISNGSETIATLNNGDSYNFPRE